MKVQLLHRGVSIRRGAKSNKRRIAIFVGGILTSLVLLSAPLSVRAGSPSPDDGIPEGIRVIFEEVGSEYNLDPELLEAMAFYESRFVPTVTNKHYYGLMQVSVKVHSERMAKYNITTKGMLEPGNNVRVAADYLSELYASYEDTTLVLMAYAGNTSAIKNYNKSGKVPKSIQRVLDKQAEYNSIHNN